MSDLLKGVAIVLRNKQCLNSAQMVDEADAEIERLTAEINVLAAGNNHTVRENARLSAEVERLRRGLHNVLSYNAPTAGEALAQVETHAAAALGEEG